MTVGARPVHPWLAGVAAVLIAVLAFVVTGENVVTRADADLVAAVADVRSALVADVARLVTWLGNVLVLGVVAAAFGLSVRRFGAQSRDAVLPLAALALTAVVDPLLKLLVGRPRPAVELAELVETASGYPSGHSAQSMAAWLAMGFVLGVLSGHPRRWLAVGVALSIVVGISRVVLGVHSPTDLLGGWALGVVCIALTHRGLQLGKAGTVGKAGRAGARDVPLAATTPPAARDSARR